MAAAASVASAVDNAAFAVAVGVAVSVCTAVISLVTHKSLVLVFGTFVAVCCVDIRDTFVAVAVLFRYCYLYSYSYSCFLYYCLLFLLPRYYVVFVFGYTLHSVRFVCVCIASLCVGVETRESAYE